MRISDWSSDVCSSDLDSGIDDDTGRGSIHTREGADTWRRSLDTRAIEREREATIGWRQPLASGRLSLTGALRGDDVRTTPRLGASAVDDAERLSAHERSHEAETENGSATCGDKVCRDE